MLFFSLLIGTTNLVSAQDSTNFENENIKKAVERAEDLGIFDYENVSGEDQENYYEQAITRGEFVKIICSTLKLKDEVINSSEQANFSDIHDSKFVKYINALAAREIIKGYPDGTFSPTKQISYEEALTVLVRLLGYKETFLPKKWPHNFNSKANDIKITENINIEPSDFINRSSLALLISNTLDSNVLIKEEEEDSILWIESKDKTLFDIINEKE